MSRRPFLSLRRREPPEPGKPAGYAALIAQHNLQVPPPPRLAAIAERHRPVSTREWRLFSPSHAPEESLGGQLEFALKWEGISLGVLSALFGQVDSREIARIVRKTPTGSYARRIWFLYEWLMDARLDLPGAGRVKAVPVVNPRQQFASESGSLSRRHRVRNLGQHEGKLSKRARTREFERLSSNEAERVEALYAECFPAEAPAGAGYRTGESSR